MDRISHDIILYILFIHVDEAVLVNLARRSAAAQNLPANVAVSGILRLLCASSVLFRGNQ